MHDISLLADFVVILAVALLVAWMFTKLRLPTIVGFLAAGIVLGPGAAGFVAAEGEISLMAEIGVVLLLFSIGLELSLRELRHLGRFVFGAGSLQVGLTAALVAVPAYLWGFSASKAIFFGLLGALSSTAIVLTSLRENDEVASPHGRGMVGVLLFQDLAVVPLILIVPLLAGGGEDLGPVLWTLAKAAGMVVAVWVAANNVFPWLAEHVVRTRQGELFTLFTVVVAVGTAYLSGTAGLSLALGAFLAGLVISESPYSEQMIADVEPFKDVFNSLFFVSMGLLVDPTLFFEYPLVILGLFAGIIALKALVLAGIVATFGFGLRVAVLVALGVSQVGEFSFILASEGMEAGLMTDAEYGVFLATAVLTMTATPFFLQYSSTIAELFAGSTLERWLQEVGPGEPVSGDDTSEATDSHVVIVGFGHNGQNLARSLRHFDIDYVVVDLNPNSVRRFRDDEPIYYGDATRTTILRHLGLERAEALIVTAADTVASRRIVDAGRRLNPNLHVVARTRYERDAELLYEAGADQVIVEEFETSLELVGQTLSAYDVSPRHVVREKDELRRRGYGVFAEGEMDAESSARRTLTSLASNFHTEFVRIPPDGKAAGETLGGLDLRGATGATVVAVDREGRLLDQPGPDFRLEARDRVLLIGAPDALAAARKLLEAPDRDGDDVEA